MVQQATLGTVVGLHSNTLEDFNDLFALAWLQNGTRCRSIVVFHDELCVLACVRACSKGRCLPSCFLRVFKCAFGIVQSLRCYVVLLLVREARERGRERKPERGLVVRCSCRRATGDRVCCDL
jgi:hypothetical protein